MTDHDLRILSDAINRVAEAVSALDMRLTRLEEQHRAGMEQVVQAIVDGPTREGREMKDEYCPVSQTICPDMENCNHCIPFIASCDRCYIGGHTDSGGFFGYLVGPGTIRCLCEACYEIEGGEKKEAAQELIWGNRLIDGPREGRG